ncbi:hypothetical protein Tco_0664500 [Tanacetum coccineum]
MRKRDRGDDQDPTAGSDQGKKKRRKGKYLESSKDKVQTGSFSKGKNESKPSSTDKPMNAEEPLHEAKLNVEEPILDDQPPRPPTPDPEWNQDQAVDNGPEQTWLNDLVNVEKDSLTFDELIATPIDFSKFDMNRLKLDKISKVDSVGPVYKLLKGDRCPYDLSKPLPLQGFPGHLTILVDFFFNNDLEYLRTGNSERKHTVSITKKKLQGMVVDE